MVARITKIIGYSPHSWQDAVAEALRRANKTLRNLTSINVLEQRAKIEGGKISEYEATVEVTFMVEE